jgi:hypothetical protein
MGIREETEFKLAELKIRQSRLFVKIISSCNENCLPLKDAQKQLDDLNRQWKANGGETVIIDGIERPVLKRFMEDGQKYINTNLPPYYPTTQTIERAEEVTEFDVGSSEAVKKQWENKYSFQDCKNAIKCGGEAAFWAHRALKPYRKLLKQARKLRERKLMIEEYRQNEQDIEDLERLLKESEINQAFLGISEAGQYKKEKAPDGIVPMQRPTVLNVVFSEYPEFEKDFDLLLSNEYIAESPDGGLGWQKSKKSLSEYFGYQTTKNVRWKFIEQAFGVKGLKHQFSRNGDVYGKKHSRDYRAWLEIKNGLPESR